MCLGSHRKDTLTKMGIKTKIEFADSTINPVMGCTGCELYHPNLGQNHCYAARLINRHAGRKGWPKNFNESEYFLERMEKALRWSDLTGQKREDEPWLNGYPRIIFVNDLSDGFCPDVDPRAWLEPFMKRMAESPHIWLLLTKWPKQMGRFFEQYPAPDNFWLGVSVPNQKAAWRIEYLRGTPAAIRFLSLEPLLGPTDLRGELLDGDIHWVICGGESGHNARAMRPDWARGIRDQCQAAGVPFFMKQMTKRALIPDDLMIREFPNGI